MNSKKDFSIRKAKEKDVDVLADLLKELFSIEKDFCVNRKKQIKGLRAFILDSSKGEIFVIEVSNTVVGMCSLQFLISTAEGGIVAFVEDMIIAKEWRRKKLGSKFIKYVLKYAKEKQSLRVQLLADINNLPALEFYKSMFFKKTDLICLRKKL